MTATASELISAGHWDNLCRLRDWNPWIVNEGMMDGDDQIHLSEEELRVLLGLPSPSVAE